MSFIKFLFSKSFVKQLIYVLIVFVFFSFIVLEWLKFYTNHGSFVSVPSLTGKSYQVARALVHKNSLRIEVQDSSNYNPRYPKGAVI